MCGIVGVASQIPQTDRDWLTVARDALAHRGPDDAGQWWSGDHRVGLAHRRLSVVDLTPAGHQPMHLCGHGLSIVFNGEIYNFHDLRSELENQGHRFQSDTDTEVLLASYLAWGTDCLSHLNGMFAFAVFDAPRQRIFMARDRAGEKPLFYRATHETLHFASELKALLCNPALPRRIDPSALDCYLAMGFVPGDQCILRGFSKLPPAHALTFDLRHGGLRQWRYWEPPPLGTQTKVLDEGNLLDELEGLLEDAVRRQLVADVPIGVLLSGGADSSLVTAMAVRRSSKVRTFSIGFQGHGAVDETNHARLIARHFGTDHTELVAEPTTADVIPRLARQFDEPVVDSSMIPTWLVSQMVRAHCTVALGGDGGDELFGGYGHHSRLLRMRATTNWIPLHVRRGVAAAATHVLPVGFKGRNWLQALASDLSKGLPLVASYFDRASRERLLGSRVQEPAAETVFAARVPSGVDLLQRTTRMDFGNYLPEDILVKVDRASMLNSLEVRSPFLDYRVIEFAFGRVPSSLKATGSQRKIILKRLCERVLPPEFDRQRKQGFGIPMNAWLRAGPFRDLFWNVLLDPQAFFDTGMVASLLKGQDIGHGNGERLFALVQFELWRREYGIQA